MRSYCGPRVWLNLEFGLYSVQLGLELVNLGITWMAVSLPYSVTSLLLQKKLEYLHLTDLRIFII